MVPVGELYRVVEPTDMHALEVHFRTGRMPRGRLPKYLDRHETYVAYRAQTISTKSEAMLGSTRSLMKLRKAGLTGRPRLAMGARLHPQ